MNLIDRAIGYFSPRRGMRRAMQRSAFEAFSGQGLDGAGQSPMNGRWFVPPRSADADIVRGLRRQRGESRELRRLNPIAAGAIESNLTRVVGTGLQPVPEPDAAVLGWSDDQAAEWKANTIREFSLFADSKECTLDRQQTFYERQELVLGSRLESGDCFTILPDGEPTATQPYRLRLQLIEADRCANPFGKANDLDVVEGVRLRNGAPVGYHILDQHPGGLLVTGSKSFEGRWYDAFGTSGRRQILHHYRPTRPEQTRGVPYLAPVIQAIKDLGRYTEAEISAAVVSAFYTVFIEQDGASKPAPVFGMDGTNTGQPPAGENDTVPPSGDEFEMGPAAVIGLGKGEKAVFANPQRPNTAYDPFVMSILTLIGAGLGIPVELLTKKFNASYSASKAALLDAWQHFRTERAWLVLSFCQPVYETWMAEAVSIGRIKAPGFFRDPLIRWAYTRAAWHGDSQGSINPKDEVAAYRDAIDGRLMTHERAEWELFGSDWTRTFPTKKRELQMLDKAGMQPVPKAGAATQPKQQGTADAPAQPQASAELSEAAKAMQQQAETSKALHQRVEALAREPVKVDVAITNEPIQIQLQQEPTHVVIEQADQHLHLLQAPAPAPAVQAPAAHQPQAADRPCRLIAMRDPVTGLAREYLKVPIEPIDSAAPSAAGAPYGHRIVPVRDQESGLAREYLKLPLTAPVNLAEVMSQSSAESIP
ncbi:phage portal protein [Piscinibacter defluvii]|uniref:phage portal protein n=1 Tax=Piscinibacter defluvii TaxID=1796922 RepID=UPI0013E40E55|nr:phage portal protein [Piscinibacter defluvii]